MTTDVRVEDLLRELAPQVLGALVRRYGQFDASEDAVQEALLAAATQWPDEGVPDNPRGWLITVASRRLTDQLRGDSPASGARRRPPRCSRPTPSHARRPTTSCRTRTTRSRCSSCAATRRSRRPSQLALTLRAVGGLTTAEIARAFLVPEATMAQRISRAKATIRAAGAPVLAAAGGRARPSGCAVVLHVLYLVFNEGYTASSGPDLQRVELTAEAIRLARDLHRLLPDDGEVAGPARADAADRRPAAGADRPDGSARPARRAGPLAVEPGVDRRGRRPDQRLAVAGPRSGRTSCRRRSRRSTTRRRRADDTDWPQIVALYDLLARLAPNPMVTLNQAVAIAMVEGARRPRSARRPGRRRADRRRAPPRGRPRPPPRDGR